MDTNNSHVAAWLAKVQQEWEERSNTQQKAWVLHQTALGMRADMAAGLPPPTTQKAQDLATKWANIAMQLISPPS